MDSDDRTIHPALAGLIELLPREGEPFPPERQELWLETARSVLYLVYQMPDKQLCTGRAEDVLGGRP